MADDPSQTAAPRAPDDTRPGDAETESVAEAASPEGPEPGPQAHGEGAGASAEASLLAQLDAATAEAQAEKERALRALADLENVRRRAQREAEDARRNAKAGLLEDLLPLIDPFTLGLDAAKTHPGAEAFTQGFSMILQQFEQVLAQHGVEKLDPLGEAFDPQWHEASAERPDDAHASGVVLEVQRVGYRLQGRLLRPAQVVVSSGPAQAHPAEATDASA